MELDHTIVSVRDVAQSVDFYVTVLGLEDAGRVGPFAVIQVNPALTLDLQQSHTPDPPIQHYAFAMDRERFNTVFARLKSAGVAYSDDPHDLGNMKGPGRSIGARGMADSVYFADPNGHILEIRTY
ncbi:MAG: VOC family protein [Alphaproteobacteria bacterium]